MTTQDTHHEHNDVDASVVKHPSAPEHTTTETSTASEIAVPAAPSGEKSDSSSESASPTVEKAEAHQEAAAQEVKSVEKPEMREAAQKQGSGIEVATERQEAPSALAAELQAIEVKEEVPAAQEHPSAAESAPATNVGQAEIPSATAYTSPEEARAQEVPLGQSLREEQQELEQLSATMAEVLSQDEPPIAEGTAPKENEKTEQAGGHASPTGEQEAASLIPDLVEPKVEEVRPFTDFIAEFRQAEEALQEALRDSQVEALSILSSAAADLTFVEPVEPKAEETPAREELKSGATTGPVASAAPLQEAKGEVQGSASSTQEEQAPAQATEEKHTPAQPAIRPVSPLLRPASRLRLPRHGLIRHQREEANNQQQTAEAKGEQEAAKADAGPKPAEQATAEPATPPRPARRYRFDRPATLNNGNGSNGSSPAASTAASESPAASAGNNTNNGAAAQPRVEEAQTAYAPKAEAAQPASEQQPADTQSAKPSPEEAPAPVQEHGRRRHSSHKEQAPAPAPAAQAEPVVEPVVQASEPVVQPTEIAPEDLPPLEYAELQKASSRRRRRHRSGTTAVSPVQAIQPVQTAQPTQPAQTAPATPSVANAQPPAPIAPVAPVAPMLPATPAARVPVPEVSSPAYTIVSGYTVSQMNQGNDLSGPFMGPDPSPARGSMLTRDGRSVRAETRTAQPSAPVYPSSRSVDNGLSTAAMTQFANIVSQALQTQTDRMVAEFRRISQAPTNVSVTLPPFPSTERVGVFVDVANLLYSARTLRMGVDFGKLLDFLRGNRRLVRAHAYCPTSPQPGDEQMFLQAVKGLGYRITTKNYKTFSSGAKKADLDLDLCMDVVRLVDGGAVDCVVLVSGDSDFMPMLDYCSDHGVRVEVAAFDEAMSATLRQSCDLFINLSMLDEIRA